MKIGVNSLLNALSISLLAVAVIYIFQKDSRIGQDHALRFDTQEVSLTTTEGDRLRIAELEKVLRQSRHRHAQEVAAQARRIKTLEEQINRLQQHRRDPGLKIEPKPDFALAKPSVPTPKGHKLRNEDQELVVLELEEQLAADLVDAEWAESIEVRMAEIITETPELEGNELIHTSCGSTFCRVEFQHENTWAESTFLAAVASRINLTEGFDEYFLYRTAIDDSLDGRVGSVFFVSRKGYELPVALGQE